MQYAFVFLIFLLSACVSKQGAWDQHTYDTGNNYGQVATQAAPAAEWHSLQRMSE